MRRSGATTFEAGFVGVMLLAGIGVALWLGKRWMPWGYPLGLIGGAGGVLLLGLVWAGLVDLLGSGIPPRPPTCRSGKCRGEEFEIRTIGESDAGHFCKCGDRYDKQGRRWVEIMPDGSVRPFVIWRPLRGGWVRDEAGV